MRTLNLTGKRFGKLLVIAENGRSKFGASMWLCRCDCGNEKTIIGSSLTKGDTQSCGCLRRRSAICPVCGKEFHANIRRGGELQRHCSKDCYHQTVRKEYKCLSCGKKFKLTKAAVKNKRNTGKYCSKVCYYRSRKGVRIAPHTEWKKGERPSPATEFKSGSEHPNWKGGDVSSEIENRRFRDSDEYKLWRKGVYEKDYWHCQDCGKHCGKDIIAHHIKPIAKFPELKLDPDNGVTVCRGCHIEIHKKLKMEEFCAQVI